MTTTDSKMAISTLYRHVATVMNMIFACGDGSVQNTSAVASAVVTQLQEDCDKRNITVCIIHRYEINTINLSCVGWLIILCQPRA